MGEEWVGRVSPYAALRIVDEEQNRCWVCESPDTTCTHATWAFPKSPHLDVEKIILARARAQTARTTASGVTRGARPGESPLQAPTIPDEAPPASAPQTPGEGAQAAPGPVLPPETAVAEVLDGDGVLQLSPIAPEPGAQTNPTSADPVTIPAGDPQEYRDVLPEPVPEGKVDAATDPQRPRKDGIQGVLVSRNELWPQTGAWTTDPTNHRRVILTRDVHRVEYQYHSRVPSYLLVARRGTRFPRPRSV